MMLKATVRSATESSSPSFRRGASAAVHSRTLVLLVDRSTHTVACTDGEILTLT